MKGHTKFCAYLYYPLAAFIRYEAEAKGSSYWPPCYYSLYKNVL